MRPIVLLVLGLGACVGGTPSATDAGATDLDAAILDAPDLDASADAPLVVGALALTAPDATYRLYDPGLGIIRTIRPLGTTLVTLTNPTDGAIAIVDFNAVMPFTLGPEDCPDVLAPGASCTIAVVATAPSTMFGTLTVSTSPPMHGTSLPLGEAAAFVTRTVTITGPGRVRSYDGRIDCPGQCTAPYPASLCSRPVIAEPAPGYRAAQTWSCTSAAHTVAVSFTPAAGVVWTAETGTTTQVAALGGSRVAALGRGEWNTFTESRSTAATWVRVFDATGEIARIDYPPGELGELVRHPGGGFVVVGSRAGVASVDRYDASGALSWHRELAGTGPLTHVAVEPSGQIYAVTGAVTALDRDLHALSAAGVPQWSVDAGPGQLFADELGVGLGTAGSFFTGTSTRIARWSPPGVASPPLVVAGAVTCNAEIRSGVLARGDGDGGVVEWHIGGLGHCLLFRPIAVDGTPGPNAGYSFPSWLGGGGEIGAWDTESGGGVIADRDGVRFLGAALELTSTRALDLSHYSSNDAPPYAVDLAPSGEAAAAHANRIVLFTP